MSSHEPNNPNDSNWVRKFDPDDDGAALRIAKAALEQSVTEFQNHGPTWRVAAGLAAASALLIALGLGGGLLGPRPVSIPTRVAALDPAAAAPVAGLRISNRDNVIVVERDGQVLALVSSVSTPAMP